MADFLRQLDIIHPDKLIYPITCIGLGGIGSFTALTLRKMGFRSFVLYDPDHVEAHNIPSQMYNYSHIGESKVVASARQLQECLDMNGEVSLHEEHFGNQELEGIVISGVDTMEARRAIWDAVRKYRRRVPLYIDGRIGIEWDKKEERVTGEWIEVFTLRPSSLADRELYEPHLFTDEEADELYCTAQAVVYVGGFIASFIASNVKKWVLGEPYPRHILFDALTLNMVYATL